MSQGREKDVTPSEISRRAEDVCVLAEYRFIDAKAPSERSGGHLHCGLNNALAHWLG